MAVLDIRRETTFREVLIWHLPGFLLPLPIYLMSVFSLGEGLPVPRCSFLVVTGLPCPTCGFTRSFMWMGHGNWGEALVNSPFACGLYLAMLGCMAVNASALMFRVRIIPGTGFRWSLRTWCTIGVVTLALLLVNWVYRIVLGFD